MTEKHRYAIIAVDFDGTLCQDCYPGIGAPNRALIRYLKEQRTTGARIILWTCRCGNALEEAVAWCAGQGLLFDAVNQNLPENIRKYGTDSRKIFADLYIDDRAWCFPYPEEQMQAI